MSLGLILVDSLDGESRKGRSCVIVGNVVGKDLRELLVASGTALESVELPWRGSLRLEEESKVAGTLSWSLSRMVVKMLSVVCVDLTSLQS